MPRFLLLLLTAVVGAAEPRKPNIIFILSDDLAQGDLGCYGQKLIQTPNLDRMAREGTRLTQAYCGTTVCAPSRTSLMTGMHMGHSPIRANREVQPEGQKPLPAGTVTVAQVLKSAGYLRGRMRRGYFQCARALCWGLVAGLARFFHQRREAFLRVFV